MIALSSCGRENGAVGHAAVGDANARDGVLRRYNVTPRIGSAYLLRADGSSTIRGGYGLFFERTPCSSMVRTLSIDWDRAKIIRFAAAQPSSRLPVVDAKGRVLGVLRQIDLHTFPDAPIENLLRRPAMLSPSMGVLEALRRIRAADAPLGIVERDARPIGLVTAKDLVEPLTGELPDW